MFMSVEVVDHSPNIAACTVNGTSGQYVRYKLTAYGAVPAFVFVGGSTELNRSSDFSGHPRKEYAWRLLPPGSDSRRPTVVCGTSSPQRYGLRMEFIGVTKYDLLTEHCLADGTVKQTLKDATYTPSDPATDVYQETLKVTWT